MAYAVQHPERRAEVALVLRGPKGTGKGTFAHALGHLFGNSYLAISNPLHLTGHFNAHLMETIVLLVDEGFWAGDKRSEGVLKQLITEPQLPIEKKGYDVVQAVNRLHVIIASNESWVVPASGLERRFCVLDVSDAHARDTVYFSGMWRQLKSGGYEGMLHDLLNLDLSDFEVRALPITAALEDQMLRSLSTFEAWWYDCLIEGALPGAASWSSTTLDALYDDYSTHAGERPLNRQRFASELRALVPPPGIQVERPRKKGGERQRVYLFPPLENCRAEWDRRRAMKTEWQDESGNLGLREAA
jgi:phage/plasmid-associated DNA primase